MTCITSFKEQQQQLRRRESAMNVHTNEHTRNQTQTHNVLIYDDDVTEHAKHLVDARRFVDTLDDACDQLIDAGRHRGPRDSVVLPLQQVM